MKFINSRCSDDRMCDGAGTKLKATIGWNSSNDVPSGTDDFGFSALPGGSGYSGGSFNDAGNYGYWWSAGENNSNILTAYYREMAIYAESVNVQSRDKNFMFSVRCVKDD